MNDPTHISQTLEKIALRARDKAKIVDIDAARAKKVLEAEKDLFGKMKNQVLDYDKTRRQFLRLRSIEFDGRPAFTFAPFVLMPESFLKSEEISDGEFRLLCALLKYSTDKRTAWPSQHRLARDLKRSVRQIQRTLNSLRKKGIVRTAPRNLRSGYAVLEYEINLLDIRERK